MVDGAQEAQALGAASTLTTQRLVLRPTRAGHAAAFAHALADPDLYRHVGGGPLTEHEWAARLRAWESRTSPDGREGWLNWAMIEKASDAVIGWAQATVTSDAAYVAYMTGSPWRQRGYATEAMQAVIHVLRETHQVRAKIPPTNAPSRKVAERLGLRPTGELDEDGEELFVWQTGPHA